jgi:uncharacterized protein (TIGR00730 family)
VSELRPATALQRTALRGQRVAVYCASSESCDAVYHEAARTLGRLFAESEVLIVYGGGAKGCMGALADGALSAGGRVFGVIPNFMEELEWAHRGLSELKLVDDMRTRKHLMLEESHAVVALPGGCGTLEELFEAITLKRLGIWLGPIVLVNTRGIFDPCLALLQRCIDESFMGARHAEMWSVVDGPDDVLAAIAATPQWPEEARSFATL